MPRALVSLPGPVIPSTDLINIDFKYGPLSAASSPRPISRRFPSDLMLLAELNTKPRRALGPIKVRGASLAEVVLG
jgi:hypothetical protein